MSGRPRPSTNTLVPILMVILMTLIAAGCSHTIPPTMSKPQPPPQLGKTPPAIQPLSPGQKQAQAPESLLPVTITADLSPVQRTIQAALPSQFTEINHPLEDDYRWRFVREGEPQVVIKDGLVRYQALYRGEVSSTAARACRLDPIYPVIEGTGRLMLGEQPDGLHVTLGESQMSINLRPESDNKCNMFNVPLKAQLAELMRVEAVKQNVARSVEQAGYVIPLNTVWNRLQEPVAVKSANAQLCLYGKAKDITVGSLKGPVDQTAITGVARQAPVALFQTPCQLQAGVSPLPVRVDSAAAVPDNQPYRVLLSVPIPYVFMNQQLQQRLFHQEMKLPTTFGPTMMIERVTAADANGRTLFSIETSGNVNGTLYYWATPRLEPDGSLIIMPDLQMADETKVALDGIKTGYWQLVDGELRPRLEQAAVIDLSQRVANMKSALSGHHKAGGLTMDLLLARQEAGQLLSTGDTLVADIVLEGTASASGRLPVNQLARQAPPDTTAPLLDGPSIESQPPKAVLVPEERP